MYFYTEINSFITRISVSKTKIFLAFITTFCYGLRRGSVLPVSEESEADMCC
jgi:hypothetical protein